LAYHGNELAYQLFGREDLELRAVADFYWREIVELNRLKDVSEAILEVIHQWINRAKQLNENYAIEKLEKALKKL